jgi:hypothetical protein
MSNGCGFGGYQHRRPIRCRVLLSQRILHLGVRRQLTWPVVLPHPTLLPSASGHQREAEPPPVPFVNPRRVPGARGVGPVAAGLLLERWDKHPRVTRPRFKSVLGGKARP